MAKADLVLVEGDGPVAFAVLAYDHDPDDDQLRITGLKSLSERFTKVA